MSPIEERIPPQNLEAEMAVIGASMIDRALFDIAASIVRSTDFYAALHETIFAVIENLANADNPTDKIAVAEELRRRERLDAIGGAAFLSSCTNLVASPATVTYYARIVREKAELRAMIRAGAAITDEGYNGEDDVRAAQARAESLLAAAMAHESQQVVIEPVGAALDRIILRMEDGDEEPAYQAPWSTVSQHVGGFMPGELVAWPAAPKVGKSGVVLGVADYTAMRYGPVALFVPENGSERTANRLLAMYSGVSARRIRENRFDEGDMSLLIQAKRKLASRPLFVFGREVRSLAGIWRTLRRLATNGPIASIVLDHVGILEDVSEEHGHSSEHNRLDRAYQTLIEMGHRFHCPVHVVQHLNREGYKPDKFGKPVEPNMSTIAQLRGGGNLEGHADHIIFPFRPKPLGSPADREMGKFVVALSRDGEGGYVDMRYIGRRHLWLEAAEDSVSVPWFERKVAFQSNGYHQPSLAV